MKILSSHFKVPAVSSALIRHAGERDAIFSRLKSALDADQRIRCGWLWGSFMVGAQDDLSDLDIWLFVPDSVVNHMFDAIQDACRGVGDIVSFRENTHNASPGGGYVGVLVAGSHGLHHLDIYWQGLFHRSEADGQPFIDRLNQPEPTFPKHENPTSSEEPQEPFASRLAFVWLMLSVTAKVLARDPASDMALLSYPRNALEETFTFTGLDSNIDWTIPHEPRQKVETLRKIAAQTALAEEAMRNQGAMIPKAANRCLHSYFDLVESIFKVPRQ